MLGIQKDDINCLMHLLLGVFAQGEIFYNQQKDEIKEFFGDELFYKAEELLKESRAYQLFSQLD